MNNPMISVVMPAYNTERYAGEAIRSILGQTFRDFEFIIINDGSTDGTGEIIDAYAASDPRIVCMENEVNLGLPCTLNRGIECARGKYICRMDADDYSYPDRFAKQVAFMESHPDVVISGGTMEVCNRDMKTICRRIYNLGDVEIRRKIFRYSPFCHPTTIYRTQEAQAIGGYRDEVFPAEDIDFYYRIGRLGSFGNLPDVLHKMRVNPSGISYSNIRKSEILTLYVRLKAAFEYGYTMTRADKIYFAAQAASMLFMPARFKYWLFALCRSVMR
ncbi:MAG: glycosyltransferase [Actinobacteria bacterium]|jgi:glycosyltransferase involved in cell wall biosynthesis|nr:MAG: glycosyltransferase [Actinomycetota bacterium]